MENRKFPYRRRRQRGATKNYSITFDPVAFERLEAACERTQESRGAVISHALLKVLPPIPVESQSA